MRNDTIDSFTSSLNSPYKDFCEEYIRLAELIIQFEQDQMEMIDKIEEDEITKLYMGVKTSLSFLKENGIKRHFRVKKARILKESIEKNSGLKKVYDQLNRYMSYHSVEREKLGMSLKNNATLTTIELLENYEIAVTNMKNFSVKDNLNKK